MQVGDIGRPIRVTVTENGTAKDVSAATTKNLVFRSPSGVDKTFAAAFYTDGTDGIVQYVTVAATDINESGTWEVQFAYADGSVTFKTEVGSFEVGKNLGAAGY